MPIQVLGKIPNPKPIEKIKCCDKEFTETEYYWHKRKCH